MPIFTNEHAKNYHLLHYRMALVFHTEKIKSLRRGRGIRIRKMCGRKPLYYFPKENPDVNMSVQAILQTKNIDDAIAAVTDRLKKVEKDVGVQVVSEMLSTVTCSWSEHNTCHAYCLQHHLKELDKAHGSDVSLKIS